MVPTLFVRVTVLPLTPSGKVDRRSLPAPAPVLVDGAGAAGFVPPHDPIESEIAGVWAEILGVEQVGAADNFFELGGDSLRAVRVLNRLEQAFGTRLPLAALYREPTVGQVASVLRGSRPAGQCRWLVPVRPTGKRPPLFFVPGAGGGPVLFGPNQPFARLAERLGPDQPFYTFCFENRGGAGATIESLARAFVADVLAFQPNGPYHLGGWSFGGLVAFEMARQLCARGAEVGLVALFDSEAPGFPWSRPWRERVTELWRRVSASDRPIGTLATTARVNAEYAARLIWRRFPNHPYARVRRMERAYARRDRAFPGRVLLLPTADTLDDFGGRLGTLPDPHFGWDALAAGGVTAVPVPGHHGSMFEDPNLAVVVDAMRPWLSAGGPR
jgi:thioesterase domain-containing protein/acyl carrier protein